MSNIFQHINRTVTPVMILLLSVMMALVSCTDEIDQPEPVPEQPSQPLPGYITLTVKCSKNTARAEEPGVDELYENKINSVVLCLSPFSGDRTEADAPAYMETFTGLNVNNQAVIRVPMTTELKNRLFGQDNSNTCKAFVAVNVDKGSDTTVQQLRQHILDTPFATRQVQNQFAMDGDGTVTYSPDGNLAVGEIDVKRSAAKITLALDVDSEVTEVVGEEVKHWISNPEGMTVRLINGVKTSKLDPAPTPGMDASVYFSTAEDIQYTFKDANRAADDPYARFSQEQEIPFYTYPNSWTESPEEQYSSYMILSVPWSSDGGTSWRTCYYHVPIIPSGRTDLVRNTSYHVMLHVGVLGSFIPDKPIDVVPADYYVADWGEENLDITIRGIRYLVVDSNNYEISNDSTINITFYTSHQVKVISTTMTFFRYNFSDQGSEFAVTVTDEINNTTFDKEKRKIFDAYFSEEIVNSTQTLTLNHEAVIWTPKNSAGQTVLFTRRSNGSRALTDKVSEINAMLNSIKYYERPENPEDEFSRIKFEIVVQHEDVADGETEFPDDAYMETITIWQYPGMYITSVQNFCENLAATPQWQTNAFLGNTVINGRTDANGKDLPYAGNITNWTTRKIAYNYQNWDYSIGLGAPDLAFSNWNPNLYLVTITRLSEELSKKYIVSDPRSDNINNYLANSGAYEGYTVDGGSTKVFTTQYWYFRTRNGGNNNEGPESSTLTDFNIYKNPLSFQYTFQNPYDATFWDEYIVNGFVQANAVDLPANQKRTLTNYYPTRENQDNMYIIAPKFRICSSYAGSKAYMTREMSRRRAAAYQELGYAAGRWRLPTYGEVEYIMTLAAQEKIPRLFGCNDTNTWGYWCAQGIVKVPPGDAANKNPTLVTNPADINGMGTVAEAPFTGDDYRARTRFVYDEWYWGSTTLPRGPGDPSSTELLYEFTWGDAPRTTPGL